VFNSRFEALLDRKHIKSGDGPAHGKAANEVLYRAIEKDPELARELKLSQEAVGGLRTSTRAPPGYTWHHHQDVGRMQLVKSDEHRLAAPHTGGMAIWGGGYP